jgi:hypothetical protein
MGMRCFLSGFQLRAASGEHSCCQDGGKPSPELRVMTRNGNVATRARGIEASSRASETESLGKLGRLAAAAGGPQALEALLRLMELSTEALASGDATGCSPAARIARPD